MGIKHQFLTNGKNLNFNIESLTEYHNSCEVLSTDFKIHKDILSATENSQTKNRYPVKKCISEQITSPRMTRKQFDYEQLQYIRECYPPPPMEIPIHPQPPHVYIVYSNKNSDKSSKYQNSEKNTTKKSMAKKNMETHWLKLTSLIIILTLLITIFVLLLRDFKILCRMRRRGWITQFFCRIIKSLQRNDIFL